MKTTSVGIHFFQQLNLFNICMGKHQQLIVTKLTINDRTNLKLERVRENCFTENIWFCKNKCWAIYNLGMFFLALGQNNDNFVSCPDSALEWKRRRHLMAEEIFKYSPDVICLQVFFISIYFLKLYLGCYGQLLCEWETGYKW